MNQATAASKPTFISTVCMRDEGPFDTFKDAFKNFMERLKAERLPIQILESACWIERQSNGDKSPLLFYDVRDFGYKVGLLVGAGVFNPDAPEPDPVLVADLYHAAFIAGGDAERFLDAMEFRSPTEAMPVAAG